MYCFPFEMENLVKLKSGGRTISLGGTRTPQDIMKTNKRLTFRVQVKKAHVLKSKFKANRNTNRYTYNMAV